MEPQPADAGRGRLRLARRELAGAALIALIQIGATAGAAQGQPEARPYGPAAWALLLASAAALLLRRVYPVTALLAAATPVWVYLALGFPGGPIFLAILGTLVTAIGAGRRAAVAAVLVVGYPLFVWVAPWADRRPVPFGAAAGIAAWLVALVVVVELGRTRRERAAEFRRTRAEEGRRVAGEQRMAIARELHDVLAHHISLISVQAGVALHLLDEQPEQARTALTAIKQASRESLGELRSVLELLRHGEDGAPRTPAPGLDALDALVARTSAAGLPVTVEVTGTPRPLPAATGLAAYRIVQEALTNVTRHAGPATATVRLGYGARELTVAVTDDGPGALDTGGSGSGLLGMAERAAALGGEVEAGPRTGGGWAVVARLPLPAKPAEPAGPDAGTPAGPAAGTPAGPAAGTPAGPAAGTPAGPAAGTPAGPAAGTPAGPAAGAAAAGAVGGRQ